MIQMFVKSILVDFTNHVIILQRNKSIDQDAARYIR